MTLNTFEGVKGDVEAFTKYAKEGLYDGTAFHRVAKFGSKAVLQAGDPITRETKYCVEDESACTTNARGFCYEKKEGGGFTDKKVSCTAGNWYGPDGFISSATRSSKDDNGKKIRSEFGKGGPVGWRKDGLSKVKLAPEFGKIPHEKGVISMKRFYNPDSAGSQFIISMSDMKAEMDGNYAAFGKVTKGLDLLEKILDVETFKSDPIRWEGTPSDPKSASMTWPAYNLPVTRQGIDAIVVK